jgi:hypothetical protein
MGAADVLHLIRESGLTVTADGDRLIVNPTERITDDLRAMIRGNKSAVLDALESETVELTRLVQVCGERYDFTAEEHAEALTAALADPVDALTCFRAMAAEALVVKPVSCLTVCFLMPTATRCASCTHSRKPGGVARYCSTRPDLPTAYGDGHPLRCLPDDDGADCGHWMSRIHEVNPVWGEA